MKLIEGMKTLKVTEKRIIHNTERINQYAALVSNEKSAFGDEQAQRKELESLIQANMDLGRGYLKLKMRVDQTNLATVVQIGKDKFAISELLQVQRNIGKLMKSTYSALNDRLAQSRLAQMRQLSGDKPPFVIPLYDERKKYEGWQYWQGIEDEIETRLEVINATTELLDFGGS